MGGVGRSPTCILENIAYYFSSKKRGVGRDIRTRKKGMAFPKLTPVKQREKKRGYSGGRKLTKSGVKAPSKNHHILLICQKPNKTRTQKQKKGVKAGYRYPSPYPAFCP